MSSKTSESFVTKIRKNKRKSPVRIPDKINDTKYKKPSNRQKDVSDIKFYKPSGNPESRSGNPESSSDNPESSSCNPESSSGNPHLVPNISTSLLKDTVNENYSLKSDNLSTLERSQETLFPSKENDDSVTSESNENTYNIENIEFNFFNEDEIRRMSVVEITETKLGGPQSLYDLRMGPLDNNDICETCEEGYDCPGHFGHIELAVKIPHPLRSKHILEYLSLFCKDCHRLVILDKKIKLLKLHKYKGDMRFKKILKEVELNVAVCSHCESIIPSYSCIDDKYNMEIKKVKYPLRYQDIYDIFSNIRDTDIQLLGFDDINVHPIRLLIGCLLVVPPCVRPFITSDGENSHDDLTYKYIDIIKTNNKIKEEKGEKTKIDEIDKLMFHIKTLMDNNKGKARDQNGKRPIKCIKKRISSKPGRIRLNIQGKRTEFCARTVIGADAMCMVDELIVPPDIAKNLTYPVRVTEYNMEYCKKILNDNKVNYVRRDGNLLSTKIILWTQEIFKLKPGDKIIRNGKIINPNIVSLIKEKSFEILPGDKVIRTIRINTNKPLSINARDSRDQRTNDSKNNIEHKTIIIDNIYDKLPKRKNFELKEGDVLERQLKDGDLCVFNRQPTLWKGSMRAKRIKILPGKTFRFNLASTQAFNADYDGDEMNAFISHSEQSRAECATILNTVDNFMSSKDSKPLLAIKQDAMTGGYKLTYGYVAIPKHTFMDCLVLDKMAGKRKPENEFLSWDMEYISNKIDHIIKVYKWSGEWDKIKSKLITDINNNIKKLEYKIEGSNDIEFINQIKDEINDLNSINIEDYTYDYILYNGHSLFSFLLPDDFEYTCQNKLSPDGKPVFITRGVLMSGTLSKAAIGSSSGSLIHHIGKDYGYQAACDFLSFYQILINSWLLHYGHTIGLKDCIPNNTETIESEINKCFLEASAVMRTEKDIELLEVKIAGKLNKAVTVGQKLAKESLDPTNNLVTIIKSGAKGDFLNITQVTGTVGQQNVSGERIPKTYYGRTLPHYLPSGKLDILSPEILDNDDIDPLPYMKKLFESRGFVSHSYFQGLTPQEFFFHAAGGREGLIDTACKSVAYDTEILIIEDNISKVVKIGEWIDEKMNKYSDKIKKEKYLDQELLDLPELNSGLQQNVLIPTIDDYGNSSWGEITSVTRHDPTENVYEIITNSGRSVTIADSETLLIWNGEKFLKKKTSDVQEGEFVPLNFKLKSFNGTRITKKYIDMSLWLSKEEYVYGTEFWKAVNEMNSVMNSELTEGAKNYLKSIGKDPETTKRTKVPRGWWENNNKIKFILPYPNKARLQRVMSGRSNIEVIKEGCIYPYDAQRKDTRFPDKFELNKNNGIFIGLFLAEGNVDSNTVKISNNNKSVITFVQQWFESYNIHHLYYEKIMEKTEKQPKGTSISITGNSSILSKFLLKWLGHLSYNKYVPYDCYTAPDEFIIGVLNGYFSGDGCVHKDSSISATSVSKKLIYGISSLCNKFGIFCKISKRIQTKNNIGTKNIAPAYILSIRNKYAKKFSETIDLIDNIKMEKLKNIKPSSSNKYAEEVNDFILDKILSIKLIKEENTGPESRIKKLYDITVPSTFNFCIFNGLGLRDK
jgi:DNA-directed RNA polymerase beta' subunit